ncbi:MAG: ATP-binding cassette domain-containing protein [Bdellovibrionota bacterium]
MVTQYANLNPSTVQNYSALPLFSGLTFTISDNDRIGLIGPNGAGKSTLLKILAGQITSYEGNISKKQGLSIGYLEQTPTFTEGKNIFDSIMEGALDPDDWQLQSQASEYISKMGLNAFAETTTIETLSGGGKNVWH